MAPLAFFWASLVAQVIKNLPAVKGELTWSLILGWEDPLKEGGHSGIITWKVPWIEATNWATVHPWGLKELDTTEQLSTPAFFR